jgi:2-polyprenyl-6-methoxyphenol hydroxylase-like FAD-dependent oxidoreductase
MKVSKTNRILISGASFAGLSTAYWMNKFGYQVTIVEIASGLKHGGTPVNILENTIDIVKRMGLFDQIVANRLHMESMEFKNKDDVTERLDYHQKEQAERGEVEYEIERDVLLELLYDAVKADTTFVFGDNITSLKETADYMEVGFKHGAAQTYDLVYSAVTGFILPLEDFGLEKRLCFRISLTHIFLLAL